MMNGIVRPVIRGDSGTKAGYSTAGVKEGNK